MRRDETRGKGEVLMGMMTTMMTRRNVEEGKEMLVACLLLFPSWRRELLGEE